MFNITASSAAFFLSFKKSGVMSNYFRLKIQILRYVKVSGMNENLLK